MATSELPPVPFKTAMTDAKGLLTSPWMVYFRALMVRVGGNVAPTLAALLIDPMSAVGDLIYGGASGESTRLAGNASVTKKFLTQTGTGTASAAPSWGTIAAADVPTLNQNTTGTASNITANSNSTIVTLSVLVLAGSQVSGNISGNAANVSGTVAIAHGGTGQTTQAAALTALTGTQSAGKYVRSDGTNSALASIQAGDVPTLNQNTSGTAAGLSVTLAISSGGTGQTSASAAFNALSPITLLGDLVYGSAANTASRLAGTTSSTKQFLTQTGTGTASAAPSWGTIAAADVPTLNQNTTGSAASFTGSLVGDVTGTQGATVIAAATVTGKAITGFVSGSGTVAATDTILQAIQKINGNDALKAPLASPSFTGTLSVTGSATVGTAAGSAAPSQLIVADYPSVTGRPTILGNWASSAKWGIGAGSAASDNVLQIGNTGAVASDWAATQNLVLKIPNLTTTRAICSGRVALTDAATITVDASAGNTFDVTLGGNRTIGAPTNPTDGQEICFRLRQDSTGTRTVTWNAIYHWGTDVTVPTLTTTVAKTDLIYFKYNAANTAWEATRVARGY